MRQHEHPADRGGNPDRSRWGCGSEGWTDAQLMLTAEEAARTLKVGRTTLYGLIRDGQLRAVHIGRSCRLTRAELIRYVERLDRVADEPARILAPVTARRAAVHPPERPRAVAHQDGLFDVDLPPDTA